MVTELIDCIKDAEKSSSIRSYFLTGNKKAFAAGADIK